MLGRVFVLGFLIVAVSGQLQADLLYSDTFPVDGTPAPGWNWHSGTGGQSVTGGQLSIISSGTGVGTGDYNVGFIGGAVSTGTVFAGYDLTISFAPTDALDNYFAHFATGPFVPNANPLLVGSLGSIFISRVSLNLQSGNTVLGIAESSTTGSVAVNFGSTALTTGTTYRIVQGYDFASGTATVWINPTSIASPSISDATGTNPASLGNFAFRINNTSDGNKSIDNLLVATTFDEALAVPEPGSLTLAGMALVTTLSFVRKRRQLSAGSKR